MSGFTWQVTLWLADQTDVQLRCLQDAPDEALAIRRARRTIANAWPLLHELTACAPASARIVSRPSTAYVSEVVTTATATSTAGRSAPKAGTPTAKR